MGFEAITRLKKFGKEAMQDIREGISGEGMATTLRIMGIAAAGVLGVFAGVPAVFGLAQGGTMLEVAAGIGQSFAAYAPLMGSTFALFVSTLSLTHATQTLAGQDLFSRTAEVPNYLVPAPPAFTLSHSVTPRFNASSPRAAEYTDSTAKPASVPPSPQRLS